MRTIFLASVCMFVALSLVGCGRSDLIVNEQELSNASFKLVADSFSKKVYTTCVDGLEFVLLASNRKGAIEQIMDTDGLPKTCNQGAL